MRRPEPVEGSEPDARTGPSAWDAALRLLGARARSRTEMADRLLQRGFDVETVGETIARLDQAGLLDDTEFAHEWVSSRSRYSGRGRVALRRELRTKGIAEHTVDEALATIDPAAERDQAVALATKKLSTTGLDLNDHADRTKAYRRLAGVLGRRGYPPEMISGVVAQVIATERDARAV